MAETLSLPVAMGRPAGTRLVVGGLLFVCLVLQRFGVPVGGAAVSLAGPLGLGIVVWGVAADVLLLDRVRVAAFLGLSACALLGLGWHALAPGRFGAPSVASLSQFLLLTAFATVSFAEAMPERAFFHMVNQWLGFVAAAGVVQFGLQFAGVSLFAFTGVLPAEVLYEYGYNLQIPTGVGALLKSNGFFLVEPSVFSQVMALGLVIEVLGFRRLRYLMLFVAGLLVSFSGTGWIVLGVFLAAAAVGMGWRGIGLAGATAAGLVVLLGAAMILAPDLAGSVQNRFSEISTPSTSGHLRFVTPFWVLNDALTEEPSAAVLGLGAGVSERLVLAYEYTVNTPVKIALEYGFPALAAYVLLFVGGAKSPLQRGLMAPALTAAFVTGAYQQFPPMLFFILLLVTVARLEPQAAAASR